MKRALPRQQPKPATTPATTPATNAGVPSDRERAPLALVVPAPAPAAAGSLSYKSFEGDAKAEAKELLQTLEFQLVKYPQFTAILTRAIEPLRAEVRRKPKGDSELVFEVITSFISVPMEELLDDTHLSAERVCVAVLNLIQLGLVDCRASGKRAGTKLDPSVKALLEQIFARPDHQHLLRQGKGDYRAEYLFCGTNVPAGSNFSGPRRQHSSTRAMSDFLQD